MFHMRMRKISTSTLHRYSLLAIVYRIVHRHRCFPEDINIFQTCTSHCNRFPTLFILFPVQTTNITRRLVPSSYQWSRLDESQTCAAIAVIQYYINISLFFGYIIY